MLKKEGPLATSGESGAGISYHFSTAELVFTAVAGVVSGVVNVGFGIVYTALAASAGPLVAGLISPFGLVPIVAIYVVRKPGTAVLAGLLNGVIQFLAGDPAGLWTLAFGVATGLGAEVIFLIGRYRKWSKLTCFIAGSLSQTASLALIYIAFGWMGLSLGHIVAGVLIAATASGFESGLGGRFVAEAIHRSKLVEGFAIAKQRAQGSE